jgi:excisionase family DNA binding protein
VSTLSRTPSTPEPSPLPSPYLTTSEVAGLIRISTATLLQWAAKGLYGIPRPLRCGNTMRWDREAVLGWLAGRAAAAQEGAVA